MSTYRIKEGMLLFMAAATALGVSGLTGATSVTPLATVFNQIKSNPNVIYDTSGLKAANMGSVKDFYRVKGETANYTYILSLEVDTQTGCKFELSTSNKAYAGQLDTKGMPKEQLSIFYINEVKGVISRRGKHHASQLAVVNTIATFAPTVGLFDCVEEVEYLALTNATIPV